jgi:hypothetical protein
VADSSQVPPPLFNTVALLVAYPLILWRHSRGLFKPLEAAVLDECQCRLSSSRAATFASQRTQINHVLRVTARYTECNLFRVVPFRVELARDKKFTDASSEFVLAKISFRTSSGLRSTASLFVVNGNLFSIEFSGDVREHLSSNVAVIESFAESPGAMG